MNSLKKIDYISDWIKDYATSISFQPVSLVIGVSGGIDSAVTSALCAKTGFKTIAVSMPIKQNINQHDLSLKHLDWLKNNFDNVEIACLKCNLRRKTITPDKYILTQQIHNIKKI